MIFLYHYKEELCIVYVVNVFSLPRPYIA